MRGDSIRLSRTVRQGSLDDVLPQLLDGLVAAVDTAIIVVGTDGTVELWNDAAEQLYGWSAVEAIGEPVGDLIVPVSHQAEGHEIFEGLRQGHSWEGTFLCRRRDGTLVPIQVTDVPILAPDGSVRAIAGLSRDLTDVLSADRDIRAMRAIAEASADAVMTLSGGRIATWSAPAQRLLGWTADEAVGNEIWFTVPDDLREEAAHLLERIAAGEAIVALRTERVAKDGTRLPVHLDSAPVFDAARQTWVGVVTMRDARGRDEVIEAALVAEARSNLLLARSSETVYILEADGTVRTTSSAVEHVLGYSADELEGRYLTALIHPDDAAMAQATFDACLAGDIDHPQVLYRRLTASGEWTWAEATLTNLLADPVVGGIVVNVRDVTERENALAGLVEREARLSAVVSRSSDVAMFFRRDGVIEWVSPAITAALGIDAESLPGTSAIDLVHPDDRRAALRQFVDWLASPTDQVRVEYRFLDAEGRTRWVEQVATDLVDDPSVGYIVANLRDVTERREAHDELARLALVDELTELPNRNALRELGRCALESVAADRCCAIVFVDVDDFSDVNDALGHLAGDELLVGMARRISDVLPDEATLTRFGSDQFAVLCSDVADLPACLTIAGLVRSALDAPFVIDRNEVVAAVSLGVALSPPDDIDVLIRRADVALNRAKKAGRGRTVVFEREQGAESVRRLHYASELRRALANGDIVAHYQPVVDLATGRTVAVEALARWDHPDLGPIAPDVFIPVAESTGMIADLGTQILDQACRDAAEWQRRGRRLQVAVNASAVQLTDLAFPDLVAAALAAAGLPADQLTIEITETAAMRDLSVASQVLTTLRSRGIAISLDDFGTGYSSLSLLKRLPVSALKVDRSFVSGLGTSDEDDQIVTGVVSLALALGFYVVGEGVESIEQAELLQRLGCQLGQGYLWSPAVAADDLLATIASFEE